jgi:uncharacterized protein
MVQIVLTPKIGTGESLICGPNLITNPVQRRKISSEDLAEMLAVRQFCFCSAKGLFALISRDRMVTWLEQKGRMD